MNSLSVSWLLYFKRKLLLGFWLKGIWYTAFYYLTFKIFKNWYFGWMSGASRGQKKALNPLQLLLEMVWVTMWVYRTEAGSSEKAISTFDHWVISPVPNVLLFLIPAYESIIFLKYKAFWNLKKKKPDPDGFND